MLTNLAVDGVTDEWADAVPLSVDDELLISIDTSVRSQTTTKDFFRLAILHAMRDLQASFCHPTDISIAVRFDENKVESEIRELSYSLSDVCKASHTRVGKIHSLLGAGPTEITSAVVGKRMRRPQPIPVGEHDLVLLGEIDTGSGENSRNWRDLLDNGRFILHSDEILLAKDVSGDGLAGALFQLAEDTSMSISVKLSSIPYSSGNVPLDDCNLDRNISDFESQISLETELNSLGRAILMKPQFCGPLLAIVPRRLSEHKSFSEHYKKIGECAADGPHVEIVN